MAKKDEQKTKSTGNGHNRVQGFVFGINLEGSDAVVTEGIRAFTSAMAKGGMVLAPPVKRTALSVGSTATATAVVDQIEEQDEPVLETCEEETQETIEEESAVNGTERKKRIPPSCNLVSDLDIMAGPMPLKTFLESKGSRSKAQDRLVIVATWLKKYKDYAEVSRDHLYTCYQQMGGSGQWKCLNDWDTYIRTLAKRKSWFEKGANENSFKVSIVATNYVDAMTPNA